jgi:hypothetical protein
MRRDQAKFVLGFDGRLDEAMHELESLLLVTECSATADALEVEVEVSILEACFEHLSTSARSRENRVP